MLQELRIKNFVIIEDLTISFTDGLNILTGETGAGKSILIDAISAVLGEKMQADVIRTGFEKAVIEAVFDISNSVGVFDILKDMGIDNEDDTLILRRELLVNGKGRCFINAVQVPITKLKEISEYLIDIHGQNEHQNMVKTAKHRELLDSFGNLLNEVNEIRSIYNDLNQVREKLLSVQIDEKEKQRRIEFNNYAVKEINDAKLNLNEEADLRNESNIMANSEKLFTAMSKVSEILNADDGVLRLLKKAEQNLAGVSEYDPEISNAFESVANALLSLEDAAYFVRNYGDRIDFSPQKINNIEERLALIGSLKKKYGDSIEAILDYAEKAVRELDAIMSGDEEIERLKSDEKILVKEAKTKALALSAKRSKAAEVLEKKVISELNDLGMSGTKFKISLKMENTNDGEIESEGKRYILYPHGLDKIEFMIAANEGEELRPLNKVASGGEMSRLMLAIKNVILASDVVETLIFDEVDAGIGGKTADVVGKKLKSLSNTRQVLLITHLPQIASMSKTHYFIQKNKIGERVTTSVKTLNRKEKVREIARMLAGEKITELSLQHAEEMIAMSEK